MGGRPKREVIYVYIQLIHTAVWQKPTQHHKPIILQLKKKACKQHFLLLRDIFLYRISIKKHMRR